MNAKAYFDKYTPLIDAATAKETLDQLAVDIYLEISNEATTIVKSRKIDTNRNPRAIIAVMEEQNQKWNALGRLFHKHFGDSFLKENGFIKSWIARMPEIKLFMDNKYDS